MAAPTEPWLRLSAHYWLDKKVLGVSLDAEVLYLRSLAYAKGQHNGGRVPGSALPGIGVKISDTRSAAAELVRAGLWTTARRGIGAGWTINRWEKWQTEVDPVAHANRVRALQRWHAEGAHKSRPHDACPACRAEQ